MLFVAPPKMKSRAPEWPYLKYAVAVTLIFIGAKIFAGVGALDVPAIDDRAGAARERLSRLMAARHPALARISVGVLRKAAQELRGAAAAHDAIVIGHDSDLRGEASGGLVETVELLSKRNPRPLIVTPSDAIKPSRLPVTYDDQHSCVARASVACVAEPRRAATFKFSPSRRTGERPNGRPI